MLASLLFYTRVPDCGRKREKNMLGLGLPELMVILVIVLVIFGANRLPQLGEGLGKSIRSFKKAMKDGDDKKLPRQEEKS
jgi:sec-independent protein translocase protein TatA